MAKELFSRGAEYALARVNDEAEGPEALVEELEVFVFLGG